VIDATTLLHLVDAGLQVHPSHHLVAPNSIRSEALEFDPSLTSAARGVVAVAAVDDLLAPGLCL